MNAVPRVSVVVAAYGHGRYIGEALRSVEAQTLREWECIVVDDASTDDTPAVVRDFTVRDPRFRCVRLGRNRGVSVARNTGLREARGEYVQLLDADDLIAPGKLAVQAAYLDRHPEAAIVYSDHVGFTDVPALDGPAQLKADEKVSGKAALSRAIKGNFIRVNAALFRRDLLDGVGGFRDRFRHVEDWDFWLRAMSSGHALHFLDDPRAMAAVRSTPGSLSSDLPAMRSFHLPVRQSLWTNGRLTLGQRVSLMLRYCDFLLEMLLVRREPVVVLRHGRAPFMPLAVLCALLLLPVWAIVRPFWDR